MKTGTDSHKPDSMTMLVTRMARISKEKPNSVCEITGDIIHLVGEQLVSLRYNNPRFRESDYPLYAGVGEINTRKVANIFLCACFLEYRSGKTDVWDNTVFFSEEILQDPENLWQVILDHTFEDWKERFFDYNLHPMPEIHNRLYLIASRMVRFYSGDGREIWADYLQDPESVYKRLLLLRIPKSIACLVVGILKDLGHIRGPFDIVGDIVDSRVLGRMICGDGDEVTFTRARRLARRLAPDDPWILDLPLYLIGTTWCGPGPKCRACPVRNACVYAISDVLGIRPDPVFRSILFGKKTVQKTLRQWQQTVID
ncbi:MAG: hypothetical protein GXY48_10495 [Methanomicrobiales archaeon]|nr:hypothetical protein [Methanomicrobiales archaeon]